MTLKERIQDDMKAAMRAKDSARLGAIRLLLAAIKQREVDDRVTLDDTGVIAVVDKLLKQRRDSIAAYEQAGRQDLAERERAEAEVLQAYLPARLDAQAVAETVARIVTHLGAELGRPLTPADMGKVMAVAKAELAGQADMAQVSAAVKAALQPR
ncbi:MAG: GatB/YqeY domain-containing protein [Tepidimonas ignava]|uniref:Yqey-like protein n=1 Tax=Tepidimonas ignava TaxID=114249 RepID=A0A4R3LHX8_9BURK|nr:GatB/YqeY domain-containing protein [Tepidimonas ignava]MCX7814988.1 GatB/YqeY domain-containing protein [Tepidimonas ignava]TCS99779.1 hypothetical protein EDC36_10146 [Tepidimonas ignava]TSE23164.1 Yqey-like protein [Tepidimonas ignava]